MNIVFAFRGVSGSGKTAAALSLAQPGDIIIDHDNYMVDTSGCFRFDRDRVEEYHKKCFSDYLAALASNVKRVFLPMCLTSEARLNAYRDTAKQHGYRFVSMVVENRHGGESIHGTPVDECKAQAQRLRDSLRLLNV